MKDSVRFLMLLILGIIVLYVIWQIVDMTAEAADEGFEGSRLQNTWRSTKATIYNDLSDRDFDRDGMPNDYENHYGLSIFTYDANLDTDNDGLINIFEYDLCDNMEEVTAVNYCLYTEDKTIRRYAEYLHPGISSEEKINVKMILPTCERQNSLSAEDWSDFISSYCDDTGFRGTLNPTNADSDRDGLLDSEEIFLIIAGYQPTDALDPDSDDDGLLDGDEFFFFSPPHSPNVACNDCDVDDDGLPYSYESYLGTNPNNADTDGDDISDYDEWIMGRDPTNPNA